ncbi:hypothetical protein ACFFRL_16910 [Agromyces hippuratus]|uniref:hypothetical protein n=1 Tax=Agromyces hippuratus TaxID=286438 RepID=UPI0035E726AC
MDLSRPPVGDRRTAERMPRRETAASALPFRRQRNPAKNARMSPATSSGTSSAA